MSSFEVPPRAERVAEKLADFAKEEEPEGRRRGDWSRAEARQAKRLGVVLLVIATFFVLELAGALAARSNVLKADALHLLMDVMALGMSLAAMHLAVRRPTSRFTFGLRRAEPVAAVFNAMLVIFATVEIVKDGVEALRGNPAPPAAGLMLVVAIAALAVNGISAWMLHDVMGHDHHGHAHAHDSPAGKGHHLNLKGARLHLVGDTLGSLAALVAAIILRCGGPASVDAIGSFIVAVILIIGAFGLLWDAMLVLLEAAPSHLPVERVRAAVAGVTGVLEVRDLHVWTLGAGHDAISVHLRCTADADDLGARVADHLRKQFQAKYVTVQVERGRSDDVSLLP